MIESVNPMILDSGPVSENHNGENHNGENIDPTLTF
jgi:hypothetical protein